MRESSAVPSMPKIALGDIANYLRSHVPVDHTYSLMDTLLLYDASIVLERTE